jgi:hypothetical protein
VLRDELLRALSAQPHDIDVCLNVGGILVDLVRVDHDDRRDSIVLEIHREDLESALITAASHPWWRLGRSRS